MKARSAEKGILWLMGSGLVLLFVLFYWKVLFAGQVFVFIDASRFFFPMWKWGALVLGQDLIPLWNPSAQFGAPYLADPQTACAYPPVFFFYSWFEPITAFSALVIVHHFWCVLGAWFWLARQGFALRTAFLGSLVFGFSLHVVCSAWTPPALMAISWLPWVLVAAEKVYAKERGGWLGLSFAWAMQLATGYPVLTYLTGLTLLIHFGWQALSGRNKKEKFFWLLPFGGAALAAVLYNLVWELPFLELLRLSNYGDGAARSQDLGWKDLATFIDPFLAGHPVDGKDPGFDYWVGTFFIGLPALCFLVLGSFLKIYRKERWGPFVLFLILSLGSTLGLGKVLKFFFPGYSLIVHSGFWITVVLLWATLLVLEAFDHWQRQTKPKIWLGWAVTGLVYLPAFLLKNPYFSAFFWISLGLMLVAWRVGPARLRNLLFVLAGVLSLFPAAMSLNITLDRSFYETPPELISRLAKTGSFYYTPNFLLQSTRLQGTDMKSAYQSAKENFYPNWPLAFSREETPVYNTLYLKATRDWAFKPFQYSPRVSRQMLDRLGIRYIFGSARMLGLKKVNDPSVEVWENPSTLPKWFFVDQALAAGVNLQDDLGLLTPQNIDPTQVCFIGDGTQAGRYGVRKILKWSRTVNSIDLFAPGKNRSLLISSESAMPGWKVRVDNREGQVQLIDHAFRGVVLEKDQQEVRFRYEPVTFRLGLFFTLLMLGFWSVALLYRGSIFWEGLED